jgi:hypothetical protein
VSEIPAHKVLVWTNVDLAVGPLIREWLERKRPPTAAEIAEAGGFTRQFAWRVLNGRERASTNFLEACESLGIPVGEILDEHARQEVGSA